MPAFLAAIFLSAFLLFQVQPIIARYILPWFGGSPAVWTSCMLFFQVGLLGGYSWAHFLASRFRGNRRTQVFVHVGLLAVSLLLLPITPDETYKPTAEGNPTWAIILLLAQSVGIPYLLISASGPLLQSWFGQIFPGRSPYRLYAVSNFGSLLGLISYPFVFEPHLGLNLQTQWWSWGYAVYGILAALCGWLVFRSRVKTTAETISNEEEVASPSWSDRILWVAFAACGSITLIAVTNQMCQDVAVVPFLWVLPLALYLLTFIIVFDHECWYRRTVWLPFAAIAVGALVFLLNEDVTYTDIHLVGQIAIFMVALFSVCLVCHGEMVRLKPHPRFLTSFYLAVSLGGAIGGALVSLVAPRIFDGYWELHWVLVIAAVLTIYVVFLRIRQQWLPAALGVVAVMVMSLYLWRDVADFRGQPTPAPFRWMGASQEESTGKTIVSTRGFYGSLRVYEDEWLGDTSRTLYHGQINHGMQYIDEVFRELPATYYTESSGVGVLFESHPARARDETLHFGCVGLGVGTLAAFAQAGDSVKFYEINSQIEEIARDSFYYLEDCLGEVEVTIGDARIVMENELAASEPENFDILFVDAFSGDSIPLHLLTKEAFAIYFQHLKPDGVLVVHITNIHVDLSDPVRNLANEFGKQAVRIEDDGEQDYAYYSEWVFITSNEEVLQGLRESGRLTDWWLDPAPILWTDDYSNLFDVVTW